MLILRKGAYSRYKKGTLLLGKGNFLRHLKSAGGILPPWPLVPTPLPAMQISKYCHISFL